MAEFVTVAELAELGPGKGRTVDVGGRAVAVFNVGGDLHAIDNACVHRGGPLGEGTLEGQVVTCPWHGWQFDVTDGSCLFNPQVRLRRHEVRVEGGQVQVAG